MAQKDADHSNRPVLTVEPLAQSLGLPVLTPDTRNHVEDLVQGILETQSAGTGRVYLICWYETSVPLTCLLRF